MRASQDLHAPLAEVGKFSEKRGRSHGLGEWRNHGIFAGFLDVRAVRRRCLGANFLKINENFRSNLLGPARD